MSTAIFRQNPPPTAFQHPFFHLRGPRPVPVAPVGVPPTASSPFSNLRVHAHPDVPCQGWIRLSVPEFPGSWLRYSRISCFPPSTLIPQNPQPPQKREINHLRRPRWDFAGKAGLTGRLPPTFSHFRLSFCPPFPTCRRAAPASAIQTGLQPINPLLPHSISRTTLPSRNLV